MVNVMNPTRTLFYDVDTQRDFLLPEGKLYVPGAERILPQLEQLTIFAQQHGIRLAGSVDRHFPSDPELRRNGGAYPDHCLDGTPGQNKVGATAPLRPRWIENRDYPEAELRALLQEGGEVYLEKQRFDVFAGNRNATAVFDTVLHGKDDVVVYGVVTEICVDHALAGLKDRPIRLHVPLDAIAALSEERGSATLLKWESWGVHLTTVTEVLAALR
jgi:nicotinamidase/pyrazinamidase